MSTLAHMLTPRRLEELRLIASGATRRASGAPFVANRTIVSWLIREGYLVRVARRAAATRSQRATQPVYAITWKGQQAVIRALSEQVGGDACAR